jgi:hypothetical protein
MSRIRDALDVLESRGVEVNHILIMSYGREVRFASPDPAPLGKPASVEIEVREAGWFGVRVWWQIGEVMYGQTEHGLNLIVTRGSALGWLWMAALADLDAAQAALAAVRPASTRRFGGRPA